MKQSAVSGRSGASSLALSSDIENLYEQHNSWLTGLLQRKLGCPHHAADIAHDVFLRILGKSLIPDIYSPRPYLSKIAMGLVANQWRRADIEKAYLQALSNQPQAEEISAETRYIIIETICRIDALLYELPDKVRQAFLLSRLEGVRYSDIAATLDVSTRTVKKYIAKAMLHCLRADASDI